MEWGNLLIFRTSDFLIFKMGMDNVCLMVLVFQFKWWYGTQHLVQYTAEDQGEVSINCLFLTMFPLLQPLPLAPSITISGKMKLGIDCRVLYKGIFVGGGGQRGRMVLTVWLIYSKNLTNICYISNYLQTLFWCLLCV